MSKTTKKGFTWSKRVVPAAKQVKDRTEFRLRKMKELKPAESKMQAEYDSVIRKRRGQDGC